MELNLKKPIVFFDLETTGINVATDRVVEVCVLKINPDHTEETFTARVNPTIPMSKEASEVTGITDDDLKDCPTFAQIAPKLNKFIENCDLAGFNSNKFDIPMLAEELLRAGFDFDMKKRRAIDVQVIYHKLEQRNLAAAYKFYCGKDLTDAHSALGLSREAGPPPRTSMPAAIPDSEINTVRPVPAFSFSHWPIFSPVMSVKAISRISAADGSDCGMFSGSVNDAGCSGTCGAG